MTVASDIQIAADVRCELGEGPIWHPERKTLIWFDIYAQVLMECDGSGGPIRALGFGETVSACALIDATSVVVVGANGLIRVNLDTEERTRIAGLESNESHTRSNDARVGPDGSLWVGTMGYPFAEGVGALYRFVNGEFDVIRKGMTTPNTLAFSPEGDRAYFSDTFDNQILTIQLDTETGEPIGEPKVFVDLIAEGHCPDGAVVDAEGYLWNAQFGSGRVVRYAPDGTEAQVVELPVSQPTCPAFGGPDLKTLFVTSGWVGLNPKERAKQPTAGAVFSFRLDAPGLPEQRIRL